MNTGEIIIFQTPDGQTQLDVKIEKDTVWLSLNQMADLFDKDKSVVFRHIFKEGEVVEEATVAKNATVQHEGSRSVRDYLDSITNNKRVALVLLHN